MTMEAPLPTETELTLLSLDYLRDLIRNESAQSLRDTHHLDGNYLTVAAWALQQAFVASSLRENDCYHTSTDEGRHLSAKELKAGVFPTLKEMKERLFSSQNEQQDDAYEYDDSHTSNLHRYYPLHGLAATPITLGEFVSVGLQGLGAKSRLDAEREILQRDDMFGNFLQAVQDKGFFDLTEEEEFNLTEEQKDEILDQRYRKVVSKFRTKLALKADDSMMGDLAALQAAEHYLRVKHAPAEDTTTVTEDRRDDEPMTEVELHTKLASKILSGRDAQADEEDAERLKVQGNQFMQKRDFAQAANCYTAALKLSPDGPHSHVYYSNRAAALVSQKEYHEAIMDSERSLALKPDYGKAHARLGLAHFLLGNYRQALEAYTVAVKYEPDNKSSKNYLEKAAKKLAEMGDKSGDQRSYSVVSESAHKGEAEQCKVKGNTFMASRQYKQALEAYTKAIELSPKGPQSHVYYSNRSAAYCYLEQYAQAEKDASKAIVLSPKYAKAHSRLGLSRFFKNNFQGAIDAYTESLEYDPENASAKSYLAKAKVKLEASRFSKEHVEELTRSLSNAEAMEDPALRSVARAAMQDPTLLASLSR